MNNIAIIISEIKCDDIDKLISDISSNGFKYCGKHEFVGEYLIFDIFDTPLQHKINDIYVVTIPIEIETNISDVSKQHDIITNQFKIQGIFDTNIDYNLINVDMFFISYFKL